MIQVISSTSLTEKPRKSNYSDIQIIKAFFLVIQTFILQITPDFYIRVKMKAELWLTFFVLFE